MKTTRRVFLFITALFLTLALCACSGGTTPSGTDSTSDSTSGSTEASASEEESEAAETSAYLLADDQLAKPDERFWMLKIANTLSKMYPEDTFTGYMDTLDSYAYAGIVGNISYSNYLESDKMWGIFEEQVQWAAENGERFWIYDEEGYPSGAAGGLVLDANPEYETMGIARVQEKVKGGSTVEITDIPKSHTALFAVAYPGTKDDDKDLSAAVDLSAYITEDNGLQWTAPDGDWVVELFLQKPLYEETHASSNVFRDRRYVNIMDKDAIAAFIELTYERYYEHVGDYFGTTIEASFTDEPSLMSFNTPDYEGTSVDDPLDEDFVRYPTVAWSRSFFDEFQSRMGYDITPYLTLLFGGTSDEARQVRTDYWEVAASLIEEAYYQQIGDWCDAHGIAFSGHMLCEESLATQVMCEGNYMRNYSHQGIIGIDLLTSNPDDLFWSCVTIKTAASSNRLYEKGGVMSEDSCFSDSAKQMTLDKIRSGFAVQYALGVTQVTSYYGYDEIAPADCTQEERDDSGMMIARMGYALSDGAHVSDVALYYPVESAYAEYLPNTADWGSGLTMRMGQVSDGFSSNLRILLGNQFDTDILNADALMQSEVKDGVLCTPGGGTFKVLVLPFVTMMDSEVVEKIAQFASEGLPVIQMSTADDLLVRRDEDVEAARALWEQIASTDGCVRIGSDASLAGMVRQMLAVPDVALSASADMVVNHTAKDGGDVYLLAMYSDHSFTGTATFRATGTVRLIDPLTGEAVPVQATDNGDGTTTIDLSLGNYGYTIVEFTQL